MLFVTARPPREPPMLRDCCYLTAHPQGTPTMLRSYCYLTTPPREPLDVEGLLFSNLPHAGKPPKRRRGSHAPAFRWITCCLVAFHEVHTDPQEFAPGTLQAAVVLGTPWEHRWVLSRVLCGRSVLHAQEEASVGT